MEKREIKFHLPGLRYNYPLNMFFVGLQSLHPEYFREGVKIASFFGEFPTSLWNGGRFSGGDQCDARFINEVVRGANSKGIPIRYTYTNPSLTEADLKDEYCNYCMKVADNGMNEVLVVSPILEEYIRKNYPGYKVNSSTCKAIKDIDELNEETRKDYYLVVLDQNRNNQFDFIEKIENKDKIEILVNSCCIPNCPKQAEHYEIIAKQERVELENRKLPPQLRRPIPEWTCVCGYRKTPYTRKGHSNVIPSEALWDTYVPMGFTNFKLEGRTASWFSLMDTYCDYMIKPEYKDEARFTLVTRLQSSGFIRVMTPPPTPFVLPK